jgi:hypothetical protein
LKGTRSGGYSGGTTTGGYSSGYSSGYNSGYNSGSGYSNGQKDKDSSPIGKFITGVILICFALPIVWMNERKQVKIYKIIMKAREACKESTADSVMDNHNFELVHTTGMLQTKIQVGDTSMNYFRFNTVKVRRDVEIYQWYEREEKEGDQKKYFYEKKWSNEKINQTHFEDPAA